MKTILGYLVAFLTVALISIPFIPVTFVLSTILKKSKSASPYVFALLNTVIYFTAVGLTFWFLRLLGIKPALLMLVLPGFYLLSNDFRRLSRAKKGASNVRLMLERNKETNSYDKAHDIKMEKAYLVGDVIGYLLGIFYFFQGADFL